MARPIPTLDRLGRRQHDPHRLFHGIEGALWLTERSPEATVRQIPPEFWMLDADPNDSGSHVAVVSCPCGHDPAVAVLEPLAACQCDRWFFFDSRNVWCFKGAEVDDEEQPVLATA